LLGIFIALPKVEPTDARLKKVINPVQRTAIERIILFELCTN
jgi:hypothetical protein